MDPEEEIENPGQNDGEQGDPELDENGEPVVVDPAEPVEPETPAPVVEARQRPAPTAHIAGLTEEQSAQMNELLLTNPLEAVNRLVQHHIAQYENVRAVTNHYVSEDARQHPDWHREHGATMDRMLSQLPPAIRTTKEGVETARLMVMREQISGGADAISVMEEHLAAMKGKSRKPAAVITQAVSIPAAQRMAQSSGGTGGSGGSPVTTRGQKVESRSESFMKGLGLSNSSIKALRDEEGILEK